MITITIAAISDWHGRTNFKLPNHDILCVAGDMMWRDNINEYEQWLLALSPKEILAIPGNHDVPLVNWHPQTPRIKNLLNAPFAKHGIKFAGFPWTTCDHYPDMADFFAYCTPSRNIQEKINTIPPCDILISHAPPKDTLDWNTESHIGIPGLLDWAQSNGCKHIICGHVHECGGMTIKNGTVNIYNVAKQCLILEVNASAD